MDALCYLVRYPHNSVPSVHSTMQGKGARTETKETRRQCRESLRGDSCSLQRNYWSTMLCWGIRSKAEALQRFTNCAYWSSALNELLVVRLHHASNYGWQYCLFCFRERFATRILFHLRRRTPHVPLHITQQAYTITDVPLGYCWTTAGLAESRGRGEKGDSALQLWTSTPPSAFGGFKGMWVVLCSWPVTETAFALLFHFSLKRYPACSATEHKTGPRGSGSAAGALLSRVERDSAPHLLPSSPPYASAHLQSHSLGTCGNASSRIFCTSATVLSCSHHFAL